MTHTKIKNLLNSAIDAVSSSICNYVEKPGKDFSRNRKLPADKLIRFLIAEGGCEMLPYPKREGKGYGFLRDGADLEKIFIYKYPDDQIEATINWWTSSACIAV